MWWNWSRSFGTHHAYCVYYYLLSFVCIVFCKKKEKVLWSKYELISAWSLSTIICPPWGSRSTVGVSVKTIVSMFGLPETVLGERSWNNLTGHVFKHTFVNLNFLRNFVQKYLSAANESQGNWGWSKSCNRCPHGPARKLIIHLKCLVLDRGTQVGIGMHLKNGQLMVLCFFFGAAISPWDNDPSPG